MICSGWFDNEWIQSSLPLGFLQGQWVLFCRFSEMWMSILKNQTHVKVEHTSEFPFGIYWWTFKIKKKNQNSEKMKKKKKIAGDIISHIDTKNHNHLRYSSWDLEWDRVCHFVPFLALSLPYQPRKSKFWKNKETICRCHHFTLPHQKILAYSDIESEESFYSFTQYWTRKLKFGKYVKNTWRYYPFTRVYHKWSWCMAPDV